jgi:hypothetical protein
MGQERTSPPDSREPTSKGFHPDYAAALNTPGKQQWNELLVHFTEGPPRMRELIGARLADELRKIYPGIQSLPEIEWVTDEGVTNVIGRELSIPTLILNPKDHVTFLQQTGRKPSQGAALNFPAEKIAKAAPPDTRRMSLVIVPDEAHDALFSMPYLQRRRHELIHAVDPNTSRGTRHNETMIITEMAAVVGEVTAPSNDYDRVNTTPAFWGGYLSDITDVSESFLGTFNIPQEGLTRTSTAEAIRDFVRNQTVQRRNSDFTRLCMGIRTFDELLSVIR